LSTLHEPLRAQEEPDGLRAAADREELPVGTVVAEIAAGRAAAPWNRHHKALRPIVIGRAFATKVNVNIGVSAVSSDFSKEEEKARLCAGLGADTIMDLSVGLNAEAFRAFLLSAFDWPLGTVPVYQTAGRLPGLDDAKFEDLLADIEAQARQGVDFMTLHAGLKRAHLEWALDRAMGIVSRGGALLAAWMLKRKEENPLNARFDEVLDVLREHDVTISIGDALRPGSLLDASDKAQFAELEEIARLTKRAHARGVQVMVEGPGHIPLHEIEMNMRKQADLCAGAPFYVLGPVVCDTAAGYDHITASIGASLAAWHGASLLCYVTPKEHLGLPDLEDVRQGLVAFKIAALSADIARGRPAALRRQKAMAEARRDFRWEEQFALCLDPDRAREYYQESFEDRSMTGEDFCSMCGPDFCPMARLKKAKSESDS
jgi:phosphomethylpyrimidine synthase